MRTLSPDIGLLSGDDDEIRKIIKWAETKRQANKDVETYREKYLTKRGSSSVLEEIKKAFDNRYTYSDFTCEIYALLCKEDSMATVLQHLTLAPSQGDDDADRFAFESMLTTLFNQKFIAITDLGDTGMSERDWRSRHKGPFYQALRKGLVDLFQKQLELLLAGRVSETGGPAVLLGEDMDIATMQMVLDDPTFTKALAFAEQSIACPDQVKKASLRDDCWQTLFADHLRPDNVRRFLLEMHKMAIKAGSSLQITTSTTSSSTTSSTFDLTDGAGAAFATELASMLSSDSSKMKGKFKGAIFTLIKCLGASLDKLILIEQVESSRARPMVLIQGLSPVIQLRQTCLGIPVDFVISSLHLFTNIKAAADINFNKILTIPDDNTYKKVMKSVSSCLESTLHSIVSWGGVPEKFAKTMKNFILEADHNDEWHCYRVVLHNGKEITGLPAFHGTSTDGHTEQHGVVASIFAKWRDRYFNRLLGIQMDGDFAPLQQYFVIDQLATLAPDIYTMLMDARRLAKQDRIKGISPSAHDYYEEDADEDDDYHGGRGGRGRGGKGKAGKDKGKGRGGKGGKGKDGKGGKVSPKKQIQSLKAQLAASKRGMDNQDDDIIQETLYQGTVKDLPITKDAVKAYDVILSIWGDFRRRHVQHFQSKDADCMLHRLTQQCPGCPRDDVAEISDEEIKRFLRQPRIKKLMPPHVIAMMAPEYATILDPSGKARLSDKSSNIAKRVRKSKNE